MKNANEFMLIFRFEPNFSYQPTEEEQTAMHSEWGAFIGNLAIQEKLVSTYQLGFTGLQVSPDTSVSDGIAIHSNQTLSGNMIVRAESIAEAAELAKGCPILNMGGNVEVRDIIPM
ncbi:MAG: YciI family protein [Leadbetterella sp.]